MFWILALEKQDHMHTVCACLYHVYLIFRQSKKKVFMFPFILTDQPEKQLNVLLPLVCITFHELCINYCFTVLEIKQNQTNKTVSLFFFFFLERPWKCSKRARQSKTSGPERDWTEHSSPY